MCVGLIVESSAEILSTDALGVDVVGQEPEQPQVYPDRGIAGARMPCRAVVGGCDIKRKCG